MFPAVPRAFPPSSAWRRTGRMQDMSPSIYSTLAVRARNLRAVLPRMHLVFNVLRALTFGMFSLRHPSNRLTITFQRSSWHGHSSSSQLPFISRSSSYLPSSVCYPISPVQSLYRQTLLPAAHFVPLALFAASSTILVIGVLQVPSILPNTLSSPPSCRLVLSNLRKINPVSTRVELCCLSGIGIIWLGE